MNTPIVYMQTRTLKARKIIWRSFILFFFLILYPFTDIEYQHPRPASPSPTPTPPTPAIILRAQGKNTVEAHVPYV